MKRIALACFCSVILLASFSNILQAQEKQRVPLKDSLDGALDLSYFLATFYGFIPFVMPITEPAVGYGAAGGPIFFHRDLEAMKKGDPSPPSITAVGGMYTESNTWGILGAHTGVWKEDRIRYAGLLFYTSANLSYYPPRLERSFDFNIKAWGTLQQIAFRLGSIKLYAGLRYQFTSTKVLFDIAPDIDLIEPWEFDVRLGGAGPLLFLDYRDNTFTPNKGYYVKAAYNYFAPWLGGSTTYNYSQMYGLWFTNPTKWLVTGLRIEYQASWGDIPFFSKPFVNLRGIPAMRYQDFQTLVFETEERFDLTKRWSLLAFVGAAKAFDPKEKNFSEYSWVYNYGTGFRYKIARLLGMYTGVDFGWGPDSWAFYIVMGHNWSRL